MIKRRILLLISCLLVFSLFSGFVDTTTELSVNSAFSGSREMALSFNTETLDSLFAGGAEDLERLVESGIPPQMEYESLGFSEDGTTYDFLFTIRFASLAEYTSKIEKLTGENASVDFQYENNQFSRATRLVESFSTNELFGWLQQAFDDLLGVDATSNTDVASRPDISWNDRGVTVTINNDTYSLSGGNIIVEDGSGRMTESIDIYTVINEDFSFTRTAVIYFDPVIGSDAFASVCETVKSYLPEGAQFSYVDSNDERSCTAVFSAASAAQLAKYTSMMLGNTAASASVSPYEDDSLPLSSLTSFEESCSFSTLANGEELPFTYTVESYAGLPYTMYDINSGNNIETSSEFASNVVKYSGVGTDFSFRLVLESISTAQGVDYNLKVDSSNSFTREIKIYMVEGTDSSVLAQIADYYSGKDAPRTNIKTVSENGQMPYICITIKGNAAQICNAENILFGISTTRTLSYERQGGLFRIHPKSTLVDSYDISSLLSLTNVSTYSYTVHSKDTYLSYSATSGTETVSYQLDQESSTIWQPTLIDSAMSFTFTGEYTNVVAIIFICLLGILLLLLLALGISIFISRNDEDDDDDVPAGLPAANQHNALPEPRDLPRIFNEPEEKPEPLPVRVVEPIKAEEPAPAIAEPEKTETVSETEEHSDDILGIFTGISITPEENAEPVAEKAEEEKVEEPAVPAETAEPEQPAEPQPEAEPEKAEEPQPEAVEASDAEPAAEVQPDPYADYVERFPMEDLPPITPSAYDSIDEYSNRDFIEDLRYLGLLDDYRKRVSRVKVKVRKRPTGEQDDNK